MREPLVHVPVARLLLRLERRNKTFLCEHLVVCMLCTICLLLAIVSQLLEGSTMERHWEADPDFPSDPYANWTWTHTGLC